MKKAPAEQAALWIAIKAALFAIYRDNPGPGLFVVSGAAVLRDTLTGVAA